VFYNEAWSTLLRSVHSVLLRTPENLINEIILIDDFSDMEHLKDRLDIYFEKYEKIKIARNIEREGLIKSRNKGAVLAVSEVLVFLDSHVECTTGWLEPLLERISLDNSSVAAPMIHQINDNTFELKPNEKRSYVAFGGFSWNLQFKWFNIPISVLKHPQEPLRSPTLCETF
jgi:polypeptide N-acetylgalactosaminyltransferase